MKIQLYGVLKARMFHMLKTTWGTWGTGTENFATSTTKQDHLHGLNPPFMEILPKKISQVYASPWRGVYNK
jgi:hypothetical protein